MYIVTNYHHTTLYTGVTADLVARIKEHRSKKYPESFSAKYNLNTLVWYEALPTIEEAITREKQLKAGSRKNKEALINTMNPSWQDLFEQIKDW